jgi:hypothetical protein
MRPDVGKVTRNSKLTLLDYTDCPGERGTLHSNRWRRQLYIIRSEESRVIAGLHAVERTTSTSLRNRWQSPALSHSVQLFKHSLPNPSGENVAQGAAIQTRWQLRLAWRFQTRQYELRNSTQGMLNSPILTGCNTAGIKWVSLTYASSRSWSLFINAKDIHLFTKSCVSIVSTGEIALYQRPQVLWGSLPVIFLPFLKDLLQSNYIQRVKVQITKLFA